MDKGIKMSQKDISEKQTTLVLNHIKEYSYISPINAFIHYQITRLAARIFELRKKGYLIETVMKKSSPNGREYAHYRFK